MLTAQIWGTFSQGMEGRLGIVRIQGSNKAVVKITPKNISTKLYIDGTVVSTDPWMVDFYCFFNMQPGKLT